MIKQEEECKRRYARGKKWSEIDFESMLSQVSSISSDYELKKLKSKVPRRLLNFTVERISKGDMEAWTKIANENKLIETKEKECTDLLQPKIVPLYYGDEIKDYVPKAFGVMDIDPNGLIQITSDFRGNISAYKLEKVESNGNNVVQIDAAMSTSKALEIILQSDVIIFDVTKSNHRILQTSYILQAFRDYLAEINSDDDGNYEATRKKTLILISSLLTWANTEEVLNAQDGFKLKEHYYSLRSPHESFTPMYYLENDLLSLGEKYKNALSVLIIGTGLIYGPRERDLEKHIEFSLEDKPELPIFGTGQNYVPAIHEEDLIRLLNNIIHIYPDRYEYIFAVEPEVLTQTQIVNVLSKSFTNGAQTRILESKFSLVYDFSEEDIFKISANLPVDVFYQKAVDFKYNHNFNHSMPYLVRRHFSLRRQQKPPCLILSGPPCEITMKIAQHVSTLLGTQLLTPSIMLESFLNQTSPKEPLKRKLAGERSLNDFTSLPRGQGLIRVLNKTFHRPRVQKSGYLLYGFPETYSEAELLEKIFQSIQENDELEFPGYQLNTSMKPDKYIILLLKDEDILKEMDRLPDEIGNVSADLLEKLQQFRLKLEGEEYATEYYEKNNLTPIMFDAGEYDSELECAQKIYSFFHQTKLSESKTDTSVPAELPVPILLQLMRTKEKCLVEPMNTPTSEMLYPDELVVELDTLWTDTSCGPTRNKQGDNNEDNEISGDKPVPHVDKPKIENTAFYKTGIITDKIYRPSKEVEGNISKHCFKKNKLKTNTNVPLLSTSKPSSLLAKPKRKSNDSTRNVCISEKTGKSIPVKSEYSPEIDWIAGPKKTLKGIITGWCRNSQVQDKSSEVLLKMKDGSICYETTDKEIQALNTPNSQISDATTTTKTSETCILIQNKKSEIKSFSQEFAKKEKTFESIRDFNPNAVRTNVIFRNADIENYKNSIMFLDSTSGVSMLKVYRKDILSEELIELNDCREVVMSPMTSLVKPFTGDDKKLIKSVIKKKEMAQRTRECFCKNIKLYHQVSTSGPEIKIENDFTEAKETLTDNSTSLVFPSIRENADEESAEDPLSKVNFFTEEDALEFHYSDFQVPQGGGEINYEHSDENIRPHLKNESLTSMSAKASARRVRFSEDDEENPRPFEDKYKYFVEVHLDELNKNEFLKKQDLCYVGNDCHINLYKKLETQQHSDWRNEYLEELLSSLGTSRPRFYNFEDLKNFFNKHWVHFRNQPPNLSILASSTMLSFEMDYILDSVKIMQKRRSSAEYYQLDSFGRVPCVCNQLQTKLITSDLNCMLERERELQDRYTLTSASSIDLFKTEEELRRRTGSSAAPVVIEPVIYTACKRVSSVDSIVDIRCDSNLSDSSRQTFWND